MLKASGTGQYTIPTAPSAGTAVAQSSSAHTYSASYVQLIASTAAALFITGVRVQASTTQVPTYLSLLLATGAGGAETIIGTVDIPIPFTAGAASTQVGTYVPVWPPIPVANATRIAAKTASSAASAINWNIALTVINQSAVAADTTVIDNVNVTHIAAVAQTGVDLGFTMISNAAGTAQAGSTSTTIKLQAGSLATNQIFRGQIIEIVNGTGTGQSRAITDYNGTTKVATVDEAWAITPDATSVYRISKYVGAAYNADKLLGRNLAAGSDGTRTVQDALRILRNKTALAGGTLTVTKEDDSTTAWTAAVTTAVRNPITVVDPA